MPADFSARAAMQRISQVSGGLSTRAIPRPTLRAVGDESGDLSFEGFACVTDAPYVLQDWLGEFTETVARGAFTKTLAEKADCPFKLNHDGITLARTKSGTMDLREITDPADDPSGLGLTGLWVNARLDRKSPAVQTIQSAMERGDVDEMSFAFWVTRQEWSPDFMQRTIQEVNLNKGDVSVVNYGANPHTAGAKLRARDLDFLTEDEARAALARLKARFKTEPTAPVGSGGMTVADVLSFV